MNTRWCPLIPQHRCRNVLPLDARSLVSRHLCLILREGREIQRDGLLRCVRGVSRRFVRRKYVVFVCLVVILISMFILP